LRISPGNSDRFEHGFGKTPQMDIVKFRQRMTNLLLKVFA
jgi:hypothetical protein